VDYKISDVMQQRAHETRINRVNELKQSLEWSALTRYQQYSAVDEWRKRLHDVHVFIQKGGIFNICCIGNCMHKLSRKAGLSYGVYCLLYVLTIQ